MGGWAAAGRGEATLHQFFDALGPERCAAITLVSADAAAWIAAVMHERCPQARLCLNPLHVLQRATAALDEVRRQVLEIPRSTVDAERARARTPARVPQKRGPKTAWSDAGLTEQIRALLHASPWLGEGYRKAWAQPRRHGIRTSQARVLRLMRAAELLAPTRHARAHGPTAHDGTITTDRPDAMW